jgi:probable F420-dependent oxidoreductase
MNTPEDVSPAVLAKELEDRGFDSLWIGEHSHIPASRTTPYPTGGELPAPYLKMMDPFISLALAAAATTELIIGTGVALVLEHDVFDLAKSVATLDIASGGRLKFGVGVGWNEEELADHRPDIPWRQRYRAMADCIGALRALWTDDDAEYHGEFFDFDAAWSFPKPLQRPHPPIVCGTAGRLGTQHALQWADEWMPMDVGLGNVPKVVNKFRQLAADAGRGDIPISLVTYGDPTIETLEIYRELGVVRAIIGAARTNWEDPTSAMPFMEAYTPFVERLR